jgi:hypothetical protein
MTYRDQHGKYGHTNRSTDLRHTRLVVAAAAKSADVVVVHAEMGAEGPDANVVAPGAEQMYGEDRGDGSPSRGRRSTRAPTWCSGTAPARCAGWTFTVTAHRLQPGQLRRRGHARRDPATWYGVYLEVSLRPDDSFIQGRLRSIHFEHKGASHAGPGRSSCPVGRPVQPRDFPDTAPQIDSDGTVAPPR